MIQKTEQDMPPVVDRIPTIDGHCPDCHKCSGQHLCCPKARDRLDVVSRYGGRGHKTEPFLLCVWNINKKSPGIICPPWLKPDNSLHVCFDWT